MSSLTKTARLGAILAGGLLLCAATPANALLILQLERVDDSTARLTGTGTVQNGGVNALVLIGVLTAGDNAAETGDGDFAIGGFDLNFMGDVFGVDDLAIVLGATLAAGDVPSGSELITLSSGAWVPIGSTGDLVFGQGTWVMVALVPVPEPSTLALFAVGLGMLGFVTRRRRTGVGKTRHAA